MLPKIIVIVGPTAAGKSALAVKLAKKFGGEIVSADSRQIYRGMDIGAGKITRKEMRGISHHLIGIKNPDENYSVADYKKGAIAAIRKILKKKKLPIIAGGTGLYIKTVVDNLQIPRVAADAKLRAKLESEMKKRGLTYLFKKLIKLDTGAREFIDAKNPRRVIRALEVTIKTGKPFSATRKQGKPLFDALTIGIKISKEKLAKRIGWRADEMMEKGLTEEVRELAEKYGPNRKSFDSIGCREIIEYLDGKTALADAVGAIKRNTKNYAKRQMTWFKKDKRTNWVTGERPAATLVGKFIEKQTP